MVGRPKHTKESFFARTKKDEKSGCLVWIGALSKDGYGNTSYHGKTNWKTHRLAYFLETGIHPGKQFVCHKCDNPSCVNIDHLFLGSALDNNRDAMTKGKYKNRVKPKTHCKNGHIKSPENLSPRKEGDRIRMRCILCERANGKRHFEKHRNPKTPRRNQSLP